jgi:NADH-quinone oxidoreductase subunit C
LYQQILVNQILKYTSLVEIYAGANWHEREAYEMFGINFENHPNLEKLYLPDGYEGNPMLKSFELISREVKPWPGEVDVEGMPEESESDNQKMVNTLDPQNMNIFQRHLYL